MDCIPKNIFGATESEDFIMPDQIDDQFMQHFTGRVLIGDSFEEKDILRWYEDEAEGYAELGSKDTKAYRYGYHALNRQYGFTQVQSGRIRHALGFGSAYGDEFVPLIRRIDKLTIVEPSDQLRAPAVNGLPINYVSPDPSGVLPFNGETFDLIVCFGVLHHIPNVSFVISEMARVLAPNGLLLLREPIVNMGDWRQPRPGLTARERGIPKPIMDMSLAAADLTPEKTFYCYFPPFVRLVGMFGITAVFDSKFLTWIDGLLARCFSRNARYHRPRLRDKFAPANAFWVCRKAIGARREA